MTVRRKLAAFAAAGVVPVLLVGVPAAPADAHGAPVKPVSRAAACGPLGTQTNQSAACRAAVAAGAAVREWDNIRVANVGGRDREVIPDGKLCSGGLGKFKGLDLARADWPATKLTAGASFTFGYRAPIAHQGTFRMYVTTKGYDPARPLRWFDLERQPFLTVTDPPLVDGAYRMKGRLPSGRTGRHLIYTIWQNSNTPDTYYSCSDVVFSAAAPAVGKPPTRARDGHGVAATASTGAAPAAPTAPASATSTPAIAGIGSAAPVAAVSDGRPGDPPLYVMAGVILVGVVLALLVGRHRSRRTRHADSTVQAGPAPRVWRHVPDEHGGTMGGRHR